MTARLALALALCLALGACLSPLGLLNGGGPQVAANGQAAQTAVQGLGRTDASQQNVTRSTVGTVRQSRDTNQVAAETVGKVTVNQLPIWYVALLLFAFWADSPRRWPAEIAAAWRRRSVRRAAKSRAS